jgi:hypothetical protein
MNRSRVLFGGLAMIALTAASSPARAQGSAAPAPAAPAAAPGGAAPAAPAAAPAPAPAQAAPAGPATAAGNDVTLDSPPEPSHRTAWPWIIISTGVALVVTATVLEVHAVSEDDQRTAAEDKLFSLPQGDPQRQPLVDEAASHDKSASSSRTAALVVGSVGFVAIAGAVVLWFVEGGSSGSSTGASASTASAAPTKRKLPSILPHFAPGFAGGMVGATF